jgi:hypothetical protein
LYLGSRPKTLNTRQCEQQITTDTFDHAGRDKFHGDSGRYLPVHKRKSGEVNGIIGQMATDYLTLV